MTGYDARRTPGRTQQAQPRHDGAGLLAAGPGVLSGVLGPLLVLVAVLVGGCQPREIVPTEPALLVHPEHESIAYRRLVLPNRLKVLLVSNPHASNAAAAMSVAAGSLEDSGDRPGLAHFLEHMLFLGTDKYPEPNAYTGFLNSHAGSSNAYTADDHTNYFFDVDSSAFEEALDRFAQFFISPLFNQAYTDREMNAVDAEHAKNLENDYWRMRQVQRMHFDPDHPINRFSTGNLNTLRGTTREELLQFYREHYSSNLMTLAVVDSRSLDELEALVRERFGQVPDRGLERPSYPQQYLEPQAALRVVRVKPVADERRLTVHFPLPPQVQHYESRPLRLLSAVLGHEGKGSLLSVLKDEGLAHSLSAGRGEFTRDYASLELNIGLTPEGRERYREVIAKALGAVRALRERGIPRYLYEEHRIMSELDYRHREVPASASMARQFSAMMQRYPLEALPEAPFVLRRYAPERYQAVLEHLRPANMLAVLLAQDVPTDDVERYYGARFGYEELTGEPYQTLVAADPDPRWHLPEPNRFIPRNVVLHEPEGPLKLARSSLALLDKSGLPEALRERLKPLQGETFTSGEAYVQRMQRVLPAAALREWLPLLVRDALPLPVRLLDTPQARVWYQPDWRFRQPKAEIRLKLYVDGAYRSPREVALAGLYEAAFEEGLNEVGYPIREAGLHYGLRDVKGGMVLSLGGYSARMVELLQFLVQRLDTVEVDEETFASIKERQRRALVNARLEQPYRQSQYYLRMLLERPNYTRETLLDALDSVTLEDVQAYAGRFLERTYVEGVVLGNLPRDTARQAIADALDTLGAGVLPEAQRVERSVRELPRGADWVYAERVPVNNSVMYMMYQVGEREPALEAALNLIARPLRERFYHELRTQQQLGYLVWAGAGEMHRTLHLSFLVQSGQYPPDELRRRMEQFVAGFVEGFRDMPEAAFEQYRSAVVQSRLERAQGLGEVAGGVFWAAFRNDARFDYLSEELAALERLTREDVEAVLMAHLRGAAERRVGIRLTGSGHDAGPPQGKVVKLPPEVRAAAG